MAAKVEQNIHDLIGADFVSEIFWRTPFALFGAFGFLSLSTGGGVMQVDSNVAAWLEIWRSIVYPVIKFFLFPFAKVFDFQPSEFFVNYFAIGVIVGGMSVRSLVFFYRRIFEGESILPSIPHKVISIYFGSIFLWPLMILFNVYWTANYFIFMRDGGDRQDEFGKFIRIFWETAVWFLLIIAINYALLYKNGELRWGDAQYSTFSMNSSEFIEPAADLPNS